jgi:hypothetical protein
VTKIPAGDKRDRPSQRSNRLTYAVAKAQVIFVRKEAVPERDNFAVPTVALEEIERHGGTVIEFGVCNSQRDQVALFGGTRDLAQ